MNDAVQTALIVAAGTAVSLARQIVRDHKKARAAKERAEALADQLREREKALSDRLRVQHEWDISDRKNHTQVVLGAIDRGTQAATSAFEVGNNVNQKLLQMGQRLDEAIPRTSQILESMMKLDSTISPAEIAHVLVELRRDFNALEKYAHESVHRLNNLLLGLQLGTGQK